MAERVVFLRPDAERIARAVRRVEGMREGPPLRFPRVLDAPQSKVFRMATFSGAWAIDGIKTVTFRNQTATPNTVSVINHYVGLNPASPCDILIGKAGTAWYLVQADLTKQPNYSASGTHVFTIANGYMEWLGVESCPDDEASPTSKAMFFG